MKKIILLSTVFVSCLQFCVFYTQAQTLYGTTFSGGTEGGGTINKFIPATNNLIVAKSFESISSNPTDMLMQASDGKLYGMTSAGGISNVGVIFSFDPSSSTYIELKDFDGANGANPNGSLIQASDGKLYGMTVGGGSSNHGVIFSYDPSTTTYTKLKDFDGTNGANPYRNLMQASNGKLYGVTVGGGSSNVGVIFSYDPSTSTYAKLKDFDGADGANPVGGLIQTSHGDLYGMTLAGGSSNVGVIFSYDPFTLTYTKLKDFAGNDGANPYGSLLQVNDGKLYGMTSAEE